MDNQTITTHPTLENFPSLPQVLVRLLEAIDDGAADFSQLSSIVQQDTASAARLIRIANGSFYRRHSSCRSVEDALGLLGLETVKTLIITTSIRQYFSQFSQQHHHDILQQLWHRSMMIAHSARVLASLTRYQSTTEAYLCGLLCDVGQLYLISADASAYAKLWSEAGSDDRALLAAERQALGTDHCEAGAALLDQWELGSFMADAVRYHHEPASVVINSHHLVKLLNMASLMSRPGPLSEDTLSSARQLFGLNEDLLIELYQRICRDVQDTADSLGIGPAGAGGKEQAVRAHRQLGQVIEQISRHQSLQSILPSADAQSSITLRANRVLFLGLGVERYILFLHDGEEGVLKGFTQPGTTTADFIVEPSMAHSLVARSFQEQAPVSTGKDAGALEAITDQQLMRYCRHARLLCVPFSVGGQSGVLVTGVDESSPDALTSRPLLWRSLMADIVPLFNIDVTGVGGGKSSGISERRIREMLHEISNPLTIIGNYLEMLRQRLDDQDGAGQEIDVLKEEMERIGEILVRLGDPDAPAPDRIVDINDLLADHAQLLERSLGLARRIQVLTRLDEKVPPLAIDPVALKQVVTNLTKNAMEAMGEGGTLRLVSRARVMMNGRQHAAIDIEDNGPGLPEGIMDQMLHDKKSSKGGSHAGMGLVIATQLMASMEGQILCSSDESGTTFTLLLPLHKAQRASS